MSAAQARSGRTTTTLTTSGPPSKSAQAAVLEADQTRQRQAARAKRFSLREGLWSITTLKTVRGCARTLNPQGSGIVSVLRNADGRCMVAGLNFCSSAWACPPCSARLRTQRALEVETAALEQVNRGGQLGFLTLTMQHQVGNDLGEMLRTLSDVWREVQRQKTFRQVRASYLTGLVRATEVTHGQHGWHAHVHVLLFLGADATTADQADLAALVQEHWLKGLAKRGHSASSARGVDYQQVRRQETPAGAEGVARRLANYLTKIQDDYGKERSIGMEMMRGDLKVTRTKLSRTPFQILEGALGRAVAADGSLLPASKRDLALWTEYEKATKGRRTMDPSKGLFKSLAVVEVADAEVAEVPLVEPETLAILDREEWDLVVRYRQHAYLLDLGENRGAAGIYDLVIRLRVRASFDADPVSTEADHDQHS